MLHALKKRRALKRKKPAFRRQEWNIQPCLRQTWRKPRGIRSKLRMAQKARGSVPSVGWRSPKNVRGLNPRGLTETLIANPAGLSAVPAGQVAIIRSGVGRKKRMAILRLAEKKNIPVKNRSVG